MRHFIDLKNIYDNNTLRSENYTLYYTQLSQENIDNLKREHYAKPWYTEELMADTPYLTLFRNGQKIMMSDAPMEKITNQHFIDNANGDVLIFGLGIGLIVFPLLNDPDIKSITIMEFDPGLIDMVGPIIKKYDTSNKLNILYGDAFTSQDLIADKKFDTIYFDIWISIVADNFKEMLKLHSLYSNNLNTNNPKAFMDSWCFDYCKKLDWQTNEFIQFLKKEFPDKTIDVENEKLFIGGEPMDHLVINDNYLNSQHRFQ